MNTRGAFVIDPKTGDPERREGFTVAADKPKSITMRYDRKTSAYYVTLKDAGVTLGPFREAWEARMHAERHEGIFERAN